MSNQVQNKPTAAYILSLLGGIFGLLISLLMVAASALIYWMLSDPYALFDSSNFLVSFGNSFTFFGSATIFLAFSIWALITSILIIVFAGKLKSDPMGHSKWGALILVFSIIGFGGWLAFIGGILALVYKPIPIAGYPPQGYPPQGYPPQQGYAPQPQYAPQGYAQPVYQQPITRICPNCGRVVPENIKFCQNCGKQLN
jgi:hypothetical protein